MMKLSRAAISLCLFVLSNKVMIIPATAVSTASFHPSAKSLERPPSPSIKSLSGSSFSTEPSSSPSLSLAPTSIRAVRKGTFSLAVIRVTGADGFSPSKTATEISDDIFGTNGDPLTVNPVVGFKGCSGNQTIIGPAEGEGFEGGVMELTLIQDIENVNFYTVASYVSNQLDISGVVLTDFKAIFYVLPEAVDFPPKVSAYGHNTVLFRNTVASSHVDLMKAIGYFVFNHSPSNGVNGELMGDYTCMLGNILSLDDHQRTCFNGAKSWWSGWYSDRHIIVHPTIDSFTGKLLSIHDYLNNGIDAGDQFTVLRISDDNEVDVYIMFNRAEGANADVEGSRNEVTVVLQDGDFQVSFFQAGLNEDSQWVKDNWSGSGKRLIVRVCNINYGSPDYASVLVYLDGTKNPRCNSEVTSEQPSSSPAPSRAPCSSGTSRLQVMITTDEFPYETTWEVKDIINDIVALSGGPFIRKLTLYDESFCVDQSKCYQFIIRDEDGGLCCYYGFGSYYLYYESERIKSGAKFDISETSIRFGNGCPSITPSISSNPSSSPKQISNQPSSHPSRTLLPSDTSQEPTIFDFSLDNNGRRRFPEILDRRENDFDFEQAPNCSFSELGLVGCIGLPSSSPPPPLPEWFNKLHYRPPTCRRGVCDLGLPMSRNVYPSHLVSKFEFEFDADSATDVHDGGGTRNTRSVALSDMDGDGQIDLVFGVVGSPNQIVYISGDGGFYFANLPGDNLDTATIAIADMNGDDLRDIIIGNLNGPNYLLLNLGERNKFEMYELSGGSSRTGNIAIGDVDGDGRLDVIVGNGASQSNALLINKGDQNFDYVELPNTSLASTTSVALGDMNNDNKVDILFGNYGGPNKVFLNEGNYTFVEVELPGDEFSNTMAVAIGDMNGDGALDVVVGNDRQPNLLLQNSGNETFLVEELPGGNRYTTGIVFCDLDGNSMIDVLIGNYNEMNQVVMNQRDKKYDLFDLPDGASHTQALAAATNILRPGSVDIVFANRGIDNRNQIISSGAGKDFSLVEFSESLLRSIRSAVGDFDGNGNTDIVFGNFGQPNQLALNQGDGTFSFVDIPGELYAVNDLTTGDFDSNGMTDIVVGGEPNQLLLNTGNASFTSIILTVTTPLGVPSTVSVGDIDGDGQIDIIQGTMGEQNYIWFNLGNATFEPMPLPDGKQETTKITVCDMNEDDKLDLLIGNHEGRNYFLFNKGNKTFESIPFPGKNMTTNDILVADVDNDSDLDIIIINQLQPNQLMVNNRDGNFTTINLQGGSKFSIRASIGDIDGNGFMDIVVANDNDPNQILWNMGGGNFVADDLPGGKKATVDCKIVDINGDGAIDILFTNYNEPIQVLLYNQFGKSCDNGGARLHSGSWCIECPSYMGRPTFFNQELSACVECLPDHEQANFVEQCNPFPCPFAHRPMGSDSCAECPSGTFYDSTIQRNIYDMTTLHSSRCHECPSGHYSDLLVLAINECFKCSPGSHQPNSGGSSCAPCGKGFFQPDRGQDNCIACEVGGYCDAVEMCGGGFTSCPPSTYNDKVGQSDASACKSCPAGTFSTAVGATDVSTCKPCPKGSFTSEDRQPQCQQCSAGSYQPNENQKTCLPCDPGTFARNPGLVECTRCPTQLFSSAGSETCSFCQEGYYLVSSDNEVEIADIFEKPDDFCLICPLHAECPVNTTLETLVVPSNFWRDSASTSTLYECNNAACQGSQSRSSNAGDYCSTGHTGPLCKVCLDSSYYFSPSDGRCESCPSLFRLLIPVAIILTIVAAFIASRYIKGFKDFIDRVILASSRFSLQAKFKVLVSFYQVVNTLENVYGVKIDERLKGWFDFLQYFNFGLIEVSTIPGKCFGSMKSRLILSALWPYFATLIIFGGIVLAYIIIAHKRRNSQPNDTTSLSSVLWMKLLTTAIITSYIAMPTVCRSIFDAIKCQSFNTNDKLGLSNSYLIADWSIKCGQESRDHQVLLRIFWILFTLWAILVPLAFLALLLQVRGSVQSKSITALAEACSFLWRDYTEATMFWEVIDLIRKIFLTGLVMFIDIEEGSTKILRLIIASIVSTFYLSILAYARPYERKDDLYLAFISNLLLICCFVLGITIQLCHNNDDVCHDFIGLSLNSYRASVLAVIVTAAMLIATVVLMIILGINVITTPTIKVISTGKVPNLELSQSCKFHIFVSHIWATGQDKTHSMVRNLQLLIPGIKIWLDVNNLSDIGDLEKSVEESTVFVLFYTKGYFASANCRREVNTTLAKRKPTIVLFEKYGEIDEMKQECEQNCPDNFQQILDHILTEDPVMWLGRSPLYYAVESTKVLCRKILPHLPYYTRNSDLLTDGLKIKSELGEVVLPKKSYRIFYCFENKGADVFVEEIVGIVTTEDDVSSAEVGTILSGSTTLNAESDFFILYLNNDIFTDSGEQMKEKVKSAIQSGINIILIHEQDPEKLGVEFKVIMGKTPAELMRLKLYNDMALPLHTFEDYRRISLSQVLCKLGARPKNSRPRYRITFGLNSAAGGVASANPNPRRRLIVNFGQSVRQINQNFRRRFSMRRQSGGGSNRV